ncbi:MAG TPA: sugar phosphate isomerase/epimerase family protein [Puia sp.]|nr:sugar phosphate isomerase/epimerase family protein [Puia sp.]
MPQLAVFPKAFMQELCVKGTMSASEWIRMASTLQIEGLEWYAGFLEMKDEKNWSKFRPEALEYGLQIPMMCCSPDFTNPDVASRKKEIARQKRWIDMTKSLGGAYCRVLSGQRRPGLSIDDGLMMAADSIRECLDYARGMGVVLILENHYKDDFWTFPEFAQKSDIFCRLADSIHDPNFGINYDPSNAFLAGDDPLDLLGRISSRVVTMHASDRYLVSGSLEDLRREEIGTPGYARRLAHGEIGKGLNNYDAIFSELKRVGFNGWISIEDGVEGMDQLSRSVSFLKTKIGKYWTENQGHQRTIF